MSEKADSRGCGGTFANLFEIDNVLFMILPGGEAVTPLSRLWVSAPKALLAPGNVLRPAQPSPGVNLPQGPGSTEIKGG